MVNTCFLYIWRRWLYNWFSRTLINLVKLTLLPCLLIFRRTRIFNGLIFDWCLIILFSVLWNACAQSATTFSDPRFLYFFDICDNNSSILSYDCVIIFNYRFKSGISHCSRSVLSCWIYYLGSDREALRSIHSSGCCCLEIWPFFFKLIKFLKTSLEFQLK